MKTSSATSPFRVINISGKNRNIVLNGQATQMLINQKSSDSPLTGFCNSKGRLLAVARVFYSNETTSVLLPGCIVSDLIMHLKPAIHLSRCQISIDETMFGHLEIGEIAEGKCEINNNVIFIGERGGLCWKLTNSKNSFSEENYSKLLMTGLGFIKKKTSSLFIPQQIHLQLMAGVNFQKGCYVGQEVIARLEHLGKVKRSTQILKTLETLECGQEIDIDSFKSQVFDCVTSDDETTALIVTGAPVCHTTNLFDVPFQRKKVLHISNLKE